ncbi:MAG: baseplate protein [Acidobacteria bacterium]|nr:MAG: baseplate protein [Acidobacteriota bacterium]
MNIQGSCLSFPFRADLRGTLATVSDRDAMIRESIAAIIETRKGERVMLPDYGIADYVFSVVDGGFAARLGYEVKIQIERYEPLVASVQVQAGTQAEDGQFISRLVVDEQRVALLVTYTARGSNMPRNLVYPLWRLSDA